MVSSSDECYLELLPSLISSYNLLDSGGSCSSLLSVMLESSYYNLLKVGNSLIASLSSEKLLYPSNSLSALYY